MVHVRTLIRDRAAEVLQVGVPSAIGGVYVSRSLPIDGDVPPTVCVYTQKELASGGGLKSTERRIELVVDLYAGGNHWEDTIDQMDAEVEGALYGDYSDRRYLEHCLNIGLSASDIKYFTDAARPYGVRRVIYQATYMTNDGDAYTSL